MQTCKLRSHDLNLYIFFNTVKLQKVKQVTTKAKFLLLRAHASESRHFFKNLLINLKFLEINAKMKELISR